MPTYEYRVLEGNILRSDDEKLNKYGAAGWELVSVVRPILSGRMTYYFRRVTLA